MRVVARRIGIDKIDAINHTMQVINNTIGWLHPIGYLSYKSYSEGIESYLESTKSKCFAHAPELFDGEQIRFTFEPQSVRQVDGKRHYQGRNLTVITDRDLKLGRKVEIVGIVQIDDAGVKIAE